MPLVVRLERLTDGHSPIDVSYYVPFHDPTLTHWPCCGEPVNRNLPVCHADQHNAHCDLFLALILARHAAVESRKAAETEKQLKKAARRLRRANRP